MRTSASVVAVLLLLLSAAVPVVGVAGAQSAAQHSTQQSLQCSFPLTVTDATGHEVTIDGEPESVVTLSPSAAQTMWEIGGKEKVVGVSSFASYLDGAESRDVVLSGYPATVNVEKIVEMQPDLVLAPNTIANDSVQQIRDAGISVVRFEMADSVASIYGKTERIGKLTGECQGAEETVSGMKERVSTVEEAVSGEDEPRVFYGTSASSFTAGPNTFIGQIIAKAGGHNIAADANMSAPYAQLSAEFVVQQDPEYVVVSATPDKLGKDPKSYIPEDSVLRETTAWEEGNVVVVNANSLIQPAPRITRPLTALAKAFHPEAYADTNATSTATSTAAPSTSGGTTTAATTASSETTDANSPGFGVATGLLAVLGAALLARR